MPSAYLAWHKLCTRSRRWLRFSKVRQGSFSAACPLSCLLAQWDSGSVGPLETYGFLWPWWMAWQMLVVLTRYLRYLPCAEDCEQISPLPDGVWAVLTGQLSSSAIPIPACCLCQFCLRKRNSKESLTSLYNHTIRALLWEMGSNPFEDRLQPNFLTAEEMFESLSYCPVRGTERGRGNLCTFVCVSPLCLWRVHLC